MVGKCPPQIIGVRGERARIAFETAMAVGSCGPPMTLMPTASTLPAPTAWVAVVTKLRSTLPSMTWAVARPSRAADKLNTASGKRALFAAVIVGLINRTRDVLLMTASVAAGPTE